MDRLGNKYGLEMERFFGAPGLLAAHSTTGAEISLLLALTFTSLFIVSGWLGRKKRGLVHHRMVLVSVAAMFVHFIFYLKIRRLGYTSLGDQANFGGTEWVYFNIFKPVLYLHFTVVALSIFAAFQTVTIGFKSARRNGGGMVLTGGAAPASKTLWGIGFAWLGFLIWLLYFSRFSIHVDLGAWFAPLFLGLGYFLPAGIALAIHRALPDAERRHRFLGRVTVILFGCLMVTSVLTWVMLYAL